MSIKQQTWEPEVIIVYVLGTGETHGVCAHRVDGEWKYSQWVIRPESELNPYLAECLEAGMMVMDIRLQADMLRTGMSRATPIVIVEKGLDPRLGAEAMAILHQAILDD